MHGVQQKGVSHSCLVCSVKPPATLSLEEMAEELAVTTRTVQTYVRDGMPHRRGDKSGPRFVARECHRWRREREVAAAVERERAKLKTLDRDTEIALKTRTERELKELELAERRGELMPKANVEQDMERLCLMLRTRVLGMRGKWAPRVLGLATMAESTKLLDEIASDLLSSLRDGADDLETEEAA